MLLAVYLYAHGKQWDAHNRGQQCLPTVARDPLYAVDADAAAQPQSVPVLPELSSPNQLNQRINPKLHPFSLSENCLTKTHPVCAHSVSSSHNKGD
jgi:hypothetical protein